MSAIEYDPHELLYRTPGAVTGTLFEVTVFPVEGDPEPLALLLRTGEGIEMTDELALAAGQAHLRALGRYAEELDVDYVSTSPGQSGVWTPDFEAPGAPLARAQVSEVFSVGAPPLGATRGRPDSLEDFRWLYVSRRPGLPPSTPLKRLSATLHELNRRTVRTGPGYARIAFPLRDRPTLLLRVTVGTPRAAVIASVDPHDALPCRVRIDLDTLTDFLRDHTERPST